MTLDEIRALDREYLIPGDVAPLLGCNPQHIRITARRYPERLGFPVSVVGSRTKIPREGFLRWFQGEK